MSDECLIIEFAYWLQPFVQTNTDQLTLAHQLTSIADAAMEKRTREHDSEDSLYCMVDSCVLGVFGFYILSSRNGSSMWPTNSAG